MLEHNPDFLLEALPYIAQGYEELDQTSKYRSFLSTASAKLGLLTYTVELTHVIARLECELAAAEFIAAEIKEKPSVMGLNTWLDYYLTLADDKPKAVLDLLKTLMQRTLHASPQYQCRQCGFKGQKLHWLCPSCKQWGCVMPIKQIGEEQ